MEKRIALELRGKAPSEVKELNLDNCRSMNIVGLTDEYKSLRILSLNSAGLTSLKGFPALPALRRLELSDNRISGGLNVLSSAPELAYLNLSGNRIKEIDELKALQELKNLRTLDLFNNEVTSIEDYRNKMFNLLPNLKYLDGFDANDCEGDDSDEEEMNGNNDSDESGEEEEDESGDGMSLSAVYNDNLEEESSASSLYEGSDVEEEEDEEDGEGDEDAEESGSGKKDKSASAEQGQDSKDGEARGKKRKAEEPAD